MVNLNVLTIPYIKKLAKECNIDLKRGRKAELINQIEEAGISENRLEKLVDKYLAEKKQAKIKKKKRQLNIPELESRISSLEEKMDILIEQVSQVIQQKMPERDKELIKAEDISDKPKESLDLPKDIVAYFEHILSPGDSITVDELFKLEELQNVPLKDLEEAINELIERGVIEVSDGPSIQKIKGKWAILTRT
ncbi:MAG: hypothetical protein BAJALOKI2v1_10029 [Promethearchaeota archaeon]|nr:MAG: hypothetical protein BAJALOKI2v1_10029 [Candidatus Lokiarchaeota archaeon]